MATLSDYAELHAVSNFTFLRGASHPEELVEEAAARGYRALALTDECSLAGVVRAHKAAQQHALHLIIGSEIHLRDGPRIVVLASNAQGYGQLSSLITQARRSSPKGQYRLDVADFPADMSGCLALLLPDDALDMQHAGWLQQRFP